MNVWSKFALGLLSVLSFTQMAMAADFVFIEQSQIKTATLDVDLLASDPNHLGGTADLTSLGLSNRDQVIQYSFHLIASVNTQTQHELAELGCQTGTLVVKAPSWQTDSVSIGCTLPRSLSGSAVELAEAFKARLFIQYLE